MHSHDRTLIASLGFADPDKREPLHDLACEYLAESEQSERLVKMATMAQQLSIESRTEVVISKGEGQYRTTIGFLDVKIDWWSDVPEEKEYDARIDDRGSFFVWHRGSVFVEVKINPIGVGEILRQVALYKSYARAAEGRSTKERFEGRYSVSKDWVVAVAFDLDAGQVDTLSQSGVRCVRLADGFVKWSEERQKRPAPTLERF